MTAGEYARRALATTLVVLLVALGLVLVYLLRQPLAWLAIALFVAVALAAPIGWLRRRMRPGAAIATAYLGLLLVPLAIAAVVVPPLVREGSELVDKLPTYAAQAEDWLQSNATLRKLDDEYDLGAKLTEKADELPSKLGDAAEWLGSLGLGLVNSVFAAATTFILAIFISANGRRWRDALLALQPPERAARVTPTLDRIGSAVGAYVAGALLQATLAGVLAAIVLLILGVPFAAPLGVVVGLFDLVPMVGATLAAVLVGIVTLFADFPLDTIVWAVWSIVYQQLENNLIQPRIQHRAVGVHPFGVIVAVLFGGTLLGVPGALLAVPVAASIQIAIRDWWVSHRASRLTPDLDGT